jgi:6-phosphofructokinase 1
VEVATEAIDRLHSTAESHDRVMVIEVMGRDAGWIALHAGVAGGADVILIPEIQYDVKKVCDKLRRRQAAGRFFSIVVVAEGAEEAGQGQVVLEPGQTGRMPRLGGAGAHVAKAIHDRTGIETRVTVLGHLQRGGTPSGFDRLLATRYGIGAVDLVEQNRWGEMVSLRGTEILSVPIKEVVGHDKKVDPEGQTVRAAKGLGIEFGG